MKNIVSTTDPNISGLKVVISKSRIYSRHQIFTLKYISENISYVAGPLGAPKTTIYAIFQYKYWQNLIY